MINAQDKQIGLAQMALERKLIDRDVYDLVKSTTMHYEIIDVLFMLIEHEYKDLKTVVSILVRMCQYNR